MNHRKPLPNRDSLNLRAATLLNLPPGHILEGAAPEGVGYTAPELQTMFQEALLDQNLGQALQEARKLRRLSGSELARRLSVTPMRVHQLEKVQGNVEVQTLVRVANALEYDLTLTLTPREGGDSIQIKTH